MNDASHKYIVYEVREPGVSGWSFGLHTVTGIASTDYCVVDEYFYNVRRWKRLRKTRNLKRCPIYLRGLARASMKRGEEER